jgi:Flp pilus assembly protein TadG
MIQCFHWQRLSLDHEDTANVNTSFNATIQVTVVPEVTYIDQRLSMVKIDPDFVDSGAVRRRGKSSKADRLINITNIEQLVISGKT